MLSFRSNTENNRLSLTRLLIYLVILLVLTGPLNVKLITAISCVYSIIMFDHLLSSIGNIIPIFELTFALYCLQLLISPALDYYIFEWNFPTGEMKVAEETYFSYVLFALLGIQLGVKLSMRQKSQALFERLMIERIHARRIVNVKVGWILIFLGILFTLLRSQPIPGSIAFLIIVLSNFKFAGFFYLFIAKSKYLKLGFCLVFLPFFARATNDVIFIDVLVWIVLLAAIFLRGKRIRYSYVVPMIIIGFVGIFILQSVKGEYRKITWSGDSTNTATFTNLVKDKYQNLTYQEFLSIAGAVNVRFNQGWIITDLQKHLSIYPNNFSNGNWIFKELIGVLLPRVVYPNKPVVADKDKFEQFTGKRLDSKVTMSVSVVGDAYGNFREVGGVIFCVVFGYTCGTVLNLLYNLGVNKYPAIICWIPLIFFYIMRPGNDLYMILNYMVKVGFMTVFFFIASDFISKDSRVI